MPIPANTIHPANAGLMLGHCLRRWPNINPALVEHVVFAGMTMGDKTELMTDIDKTD